MLLKMTEEDINKGVRGSRYYCPIANCIKRLLDPDRVGVGHTEIEINDSCYRHTKRTREFISKFDRGEPVTPLSNFRLGREK